MLLSRNYTLFYSVILHGFVWYYICIYVCLIVMERCKHGNRYVGKNVGRHQEQNSIRAQDSFVFLLLCVPWTSAQLLYFHPFSRTMYKSKGITSGLRVSSRPINEALFLFLKIRGHLKNRYVVHLIDSSICNGGNTLVCVVLLLWLLWFANIMKMIWLW